MLKKLAKAGGTYSPYNLNVYNELFYKYADLKLIDKLPNLFIKLDLFNTALHSKITAELGLEKIKVMELASGKKMDRWQTFKEANKDCKWEIFLTDFDKVLLPNPKAFVENDNFKFSAQVYNLFDNFPKLGSNEKYDVMLSTYTFDNLWLSDDFHLIKINNIWYKKLYKLDLSKVERQINDLENGKKLESQFFKDLKIKTKRTKVDLSSIQHGVYIDKFFKDHENVSVNFPGGLIKTIVNSFDNQLKKKGMFITADIATVGDNKEKGIKSVNETIKIKIENYALAKFILEKLGFQVELESVYEFIKHSGIITPVEIHDHFVLTVKRKV